MRVVNRRLYALVIAVAAARLAMQVVAMPPYAGLDELYHVARLAFVMEEHRNPTTREASIPAYLEATTQRKADAVPSFALLQDQWRNAPPVRDRAAAPVKPYARPNYEAQQPSGYYSLVAPLARLAPRTVLNELRVWRWASVLFALVTIVAIASIGERWLGSAGIAAAALVPFLPTWETLVLRAGNDALACALVASAIAVTVRKSSVVAEALLWAAAIAIKLYTWPLAIAVPILWWRQRAPKSRAIAVTLAALIAALLTVADLSARTKNPIGVVAYSEATSAPPRLDVLQLVKVSIASAAWTSGEHFDALRPWAIAAYVLPVLVAIALAWRRSDAALVAAVLLAFAAAQCVNVILCIIKQTPQIGGKEGWYWFVLAPLLVPALLAPAAARFRWLPWWIVAWDVVITDCELIPTWAGLTSPSHPSLLFRWGPMHLPAAWAIGFRVVQVAGLIAIRTMKDER